MIEVNVLTTESDLKYFVRSLLVAYGLSERDATIATEAIVYADLNGIASHGVENLLEFHIPGLDGGGIKPDTQCSEVIDLGAITVWDAQRCLGLVAASNAADKAIDLAKRYGIGCVCVRNSSHFGAAGYHAERISRAGMVGFVISNLGANARGHPLGSVKPLIGTNPIGFSAAGEHGERLVLDIGLTTTAISRIWQAERNGEKVEPGQLLDTGGQDVLDPRQHTVGNAFLPMLGGWNKGTGGHKGAGLGLMAEVLCGAMIGAATALDPPEDVRKTSVGHLIMAFDQSRLVPGFPVRLSEVLESYRSAETHSGWPPLHAPGDRRAETAEMRRQNGIPLSTSVVSQLNALADDRLISRLTLKAGAWPHVAREPHTSSTFDEPAHN